MVFKYLQRILHLNTYLIFSMPSIHLHTHLIKILIKRNLPPIFLNKILMNSLQNPINNSIHNKFPEIYQFNHQRVLSQKLPHRIITNLAIKLKNISLIYPFSKRKSLNSLLRQLIQYFTYLFSSPINISSRKNIDYFHQSIVM